MKVAAVLKSKGRAVATAHIETPLEDIATQLAHRKIGAIVIVDDKERLVGIVSERDLVRAVAENGAIILNQPVSRAMTRNVTTCHENHTIDELMAIMTKGRFRHVPVVENEAIVGIISIGDVVKHHIAEVEMEVTAMKDYLATG